MRLAPVLTSKAWVAAVVSTAAVLLVVGGCKVGYPFRGPGYDSERGVVHPDAGKTVLVVVTRGDTEAGRGDTFADDLRAVMDSMSEQDGLIGYAVRRELVGSRVWTMSVWINRASMERFVRSAAHRDAMASGSIAENSFMSTTAEIDASRVPPGWTEAERMLEGRPRQE